MYTNHTHFPGLIGLFSHPCDLQPRKQTQNKTKQTNKDQVKIVLPI